MRVELTQLDREILARHDAGVRGRALIELAIVDALIRAGADAGYRFAIEDEDDDLADGDALKSALFNLDDATLLVFNGNRSQAFGWIRLVFGNDGYDLISDHSVNLEEFLEPVNAVADLWA